MHPADLPRVVAAWQRAVEPGRVESEHRIRRRRRYRRFQSRGLPLHNAEGRIVRWYNLLTDIDARKQSEEKLRRSEADLLEAQAEPFRELATRSCVWSIHRLSRSASHTRSRVGGASVDDRPDVQRDSS